MNCKVLIRHSDLNLSRLGKNLEIQFGRKPLSATEWKSKSAMYKDLAGVDNQLIWGSHDDGSILYGLLIASPNVTLIWAEYAGGSDWTFIQFRQIIENFAYAIKRSQRGLGYMTRTLIVEESALYAVTDQSPLGVKVRIQNRASKLGEVTPKELTVSGLIFCLALLAQFNSQTKPAGQFFLELSSWLFPAFYGWLALLFWGIIVVCWKWIGGRIEVKFDA